MTITEGEVIDIPMSVRSIEESKHGKVYNMTYTDDGVEYSMTIDEWALLHAIAYSLKKEHEE